MSNCYLCNNILNKKNTSKEHILSNACGGRLKSYKLLCKTCNEKMGADFDSELARQISHFSVSPDIKRDRKRSLAVREKQAVIREMHVEPIDRNAVHKSIAKSAISFFILKKGDRKFIQHLIPFLSNTETLDAVEPHLPDKLSYKYDPEELSHIIKLVGRPSDKILYCYIGLFNTSGFIVRLNDDYDGPSIDKTYIYDVLQSIELKKEFTLDYTRDRLFSFFLENKTDKNHTER